MLTRYDRFIVWLAFKVANRNARKWNLHQLEERIHELEHEPNPNNGHIALLTAYRAYWLKNSSLDANYPFGW